MTRQLQGFERLCSRMQARYGSHDPMVQQLLAELAGRRAEKPPCNHPNYQRGCARMAQRRLTR